MLPVLDDWKQIIKDMIKCRPGIPNLNYVHDITSGTYICEYDDGARIITEIPIWLLDQQSFGQIADIFVTQYLYDVKEFGMNSK